MQDSSSNSESTTMPSLPLPLFLVRRKRKCLLLSSAAAASILIFIAALLRRYPRLTKLSVLKEVWLFFVFFAIVFKYFIQQVIVNQNLSALEKYDSYFDDFHPMAKVI